MRIFLSFEKMTWVVKFHFIRGETNFFLMHSQFSFINVQIKLILHQFNLEICSSFLPETFSYWNAWFDLSKFTACFRTHLFLSTLENTWKYTLAKLILPGVFFKICMVFFTELWDFICFVHKNNAPWTIIHFINGL